MNTPLLLMPRNSSFMKSNRQWELLERLQKEGRLSHAYLFTRLGNSQKELMARRLAQLIQCGESKKPCGQCRICRDIEKEQFADLLVIRSSQSESSQKNDTDMMEISIGQIRRVGRFLSLTSQYGKGKCAVIENAERMSQEAQHSFLKLLEEPKGQALIILTSAKPELLLPTVRSRCQVVAWSTNGLELSPEELTMLEQLKKAYSLALAEKFNFVKRLDPSNSQFDACLNALRWHFRNQLLDEIAKPEPRESIVQHLTAMLKNIESISRQAAVSEINKKMALEVLLMEA